MPVCAGVRLTLGSRRRFGRTTFVTWEPELHAPVAIYTLRGFHNLYYNLSGTRSIRVEGTWYTLEEDSLLISLDGEGCVAPRMSAPCRAITVHVSSDREDRSCPGRAAADREAPDRTSTERADSFCVVPRLSTHPGVRFRMLFEEMVYLANSPEPQDRQVALLRLEEALLLLERGAGGAGREKTAGQDVLLPLIREDMLFFPRRDYRAASLAARLNVSEATLRRRFRAATGKGLKAYHNEIRIRMAMELLEANRRISLKELAEHLGFYDQFHFSKTFKAITGSSPREFRKGEHHTTTVESASREERSASRAPR